MNLARKLSLLARIERQRVDGLRHDLAILEAAVAGARAEMTALRASVVREGTPDAILQCGPDWVAYATGARSRERRLQRDVDACLVHRRTLAASLEATVARMKSVETAGDRLHDRDRAEAERKQTLLVQDMAGERVAGAMLRTRGRGSP